MKVSRTVLRELKSRYLVVLKKAFLLGCFLIATPVMAEDEKPKNFNNVNYEDLYDDWELNSDEQVTFKNSTITLKINSNFLGEKYHFENSVINVADGSVSENIFYNNNLSLLNTELIFDVFLENGQLSADKIQQNNQNSTGAADPTATVFNLDLSKIQLNATQNTQLTNVISAQVLDGVSFYSTRDVFVIANEHQYAMGITPDKQGIQLTYFNNTNVNKLNFETNSNMDVIIKTALDIENKNIIAHNLVLEKDSNLTLKLNKLSDYGAISAKEIISDESAQINIAFGDDFETGVYHIFKIDDASTLPTVQFLDDKYSILDLGNGSYSFMNNDVSALMTSYDLDSSQALVAMALHKNTGSNLKFQTAQKEIFQHLNSKNPVLVQKGKKALDNLGGNAQPIVQSVMTAHFKNIVDVAESHMPSLLKGHAGGDDLEPIKMWMKGLYGYAKYDGDDFKTHEKGAAIGLTKQISQSVSLGLGYAYTNTDINQSIRDTDVNTNTGFAFVKYQPSNWFVNGVISYSHSKYEEEKSILSSKSSDNYHSNMYAFQTMIGYDKLFEKFTITPKTGMRYIHIEQDSYQDSFGTRIAENTYQYLTMLAGIDVESNCIKINDFCIMPKAGFSLSYDVKSDDTQAINTLNNNVAYLIQGDSLERFATQLHFGFNATLNNIIDFSLEYMGSYRHSYQEHGGALKLLYHF